MTKNYLGKQEKKVDLLQIKHIIINNNKVDRFSIYFILKGSENWKNLFLYLTSRIEKFCLDLGF